MRTVSVTDITPELLEELTEALANGREDEIILVRKGRVMARMTPAAQSTQRGKRIFGILEGEVTLPEGWEDAFKALDKDVEASFEESLSRDRDLLPEAVVMDPKTIRSR